MLAGVLDFAIVTLFAAILALFTARLLVAVTGLQAGIFFIRASLSTP